MDLRVSLYQIVRTILESLKSLVLFLSKLINNFLFIFLLPGLDSGYIHLLSDDEVNEVVKPVLVFLDIFQAFFNFLALFSEVSFQLVNIFDDLF